MDGCLERGRSLYGLADRVSNVESNVRSDKSDDPHTDVQTDSPRPDAIALLTADDEISLFLSAHALYEVAGTGT